MTRGAGERAMSIAVMGDGAAIRRGARRHERECGWQQKEKAAHRQILASGGMLMIGQRC
jgi:hypothetical protein